MDDALAMQVTEGLETLSGNFEHQTEGRFFEDFDELYWNVTGNGWNFVIENVEAVVEGSETELAEFIDKGCPMVLGGPLSHVMAAKAVAFAEARQPAFKDYARQDSATHFDKIDLNSVVEAAGRLTFNKIKNATNHYKTNLTKLPDIFGNRQRLEQVVINLIQNSCEALSGPEKAITISTTFDKGEGRVKLAVTDEGCGIDPQSITKVMDPFYTSKRTMGGTGLGLSVSAGIIKEHDATIKFESNFGTGTTVTLAFKPAKDNPRLPGQ